MGTELAALVKMLKLSFGKLTVAQSEFGKTFSDFLKIKKKILKYFLYTILLGWVCCKAGAFPGKEGGIKVLADLAPYSQRVGSLLRTPLSGNSARKNWQKVSLAG